MNSEQSRESLKSFPKEKKTTDIHSTTKKSDFHLQYQMPKGSGEKLFQNGRVKTSKNPLHYKGKENTGKTGQNQLLQKPGY